MKNQKTVREWLETLPEPYRTQALHNCDTDPAPTDHLFAPDLLSAISRAFLWGDVPEGHNYWRDLCRKLKANK